MKTPPAPVEGGDGGGSSDDIIASPVRSQKNAERAHHHQRQHQQEHPRLTTSITSFLVRNHHRNHRPIALVTSGGTACDLEVNGVRSLENFSTGRRGASSVERFLERGYAVIHLWRVGSASPFARTVAELGLGLRGRPHHGMDVDCLGNMFACPHCHGMDDDDRKRRGGGDDDLCFCRATTLVSEDGSVVTPSSKTRRDDDDGGEDWFDFLKYENEDDVDVDAAADIEMKRRREELVDGYTTNTTGNGGGIVGSPPPRLSSSISSSTEIRRALACRSEALGEGTLLTVPFRTVEEYLSKLEVICRCLEESSSCGRTALIYLAAAVSDFYIPENERSVHKIQSREVVAASTSSGEDEQGCLVLKLRPVPKKIRDLREQWSPHAFVVSFKLETDPTILEKKARMAVENYGVHLVVANILATRNDKVWMLSGVATEGAGEEKEGDGGNRTGGGAGGDMVELVRDDQANDQELEDLIVEHVTERHFEYLASAGPDGAVGGIVAPDGGAVVDYARRSRELVERRRREIKIELWRRRVIDLLLNVGGTLIGMYVSYWVGGALRRRIHRL